MLHVSALFIPDDGPKKGRNKKKYEVVAFVFPLLQQTRQVSTENREEGNLTSNSATNKGRPNKTLCNPHAYQPRLTRSVV
jgi:hypothetical protein